MIKVPFDRQYALSIKNEVKLPNFLRLYQNNDYENKLYPLSSVSNFFIYQKKPPSLKTVYLAYSKNEKTNEIIETEKTQEKKNSQIENNITKNMNLYQDSQLLFFNSFQKSQLNSENKEKSENNM